jgi:[ribosomal protein S18]-alanine N-acetyltransferase
MNAAAAHWRLQPMCADELAQVLQIEQQCHPHPWTAGHFADSLAGGHQAQILSAQGLAAPRPQVAGYFVAMQILDEVHLLNLAVAPAHQGQGCARVLLHALSLWAQGAGAQQLWLEVRASNARALALYHRFGFVQQGLRKGYYPASLSATKILHSNENHYPIKPPQPLPQREDAVVMSCKL